MNFNMLSVVKKNSIIFSQCFAAVCFVVFALTMCFESLCAEYAEVCSNKYPGGTCPAGQSCLLNGKNYGCYGKCAKNSFGSCLKDGICLVSFTHISNKLKRTYFYECFSCADSNPFGSCPANQSCFTCNGSTKCVADDFVCKKKSTNIVSGVNNFAATTTKAASMPGATTTKAPLVPVAKTTKAASVPVATTTKVASVPGATTAKAGSVPGATTTKAGSVPGATTTKAK